MVIFKHNQNVVEAYEVEIVKDDSLGLEDSFNEEAISCYRKFTELKQG